MELTSKILSIISKDACRGKTVQPNDRIVEDLGVDSLDKLMIVHDLEDEFNITVEDEEMESVRLVQDIIDAVGRKISLSHS
jgi:acyl carrier protein